MTGIEEGPLLELKLLCEKVLMEQCISCRRVQYFIPLFHLLFHRVRKKKQLQNETDIKNANMFK